MKQIILPIFAIIISKPGSEPVYIEEIKESSAMALVSRGGFAFLSREWWVLHYNNCKNTLLLCNPIIHSWRTTNATNQRPATDITASLKPSRWQGVGTIIPITYAIYTSYKTKPHWHKSPL